MNKQCGRSQWDRFLIEQIESAVVKAGVTLWYLGGPSICLRTRAAVIYMDLYTGPSVEGVHRMCAVPLDPYDVAKCTALLSTHCHADHCEKESLLPIWQRTNCRLIGPASSVKLMRDWGVSDRNITVLGKGESVALEDLIITALAANDCDDRAAVAYVFETKRATVFAGGDTRYFKGMANIGKSFNIDIALVSLGKNPPGQDVFMEARDVVMAAGALRAKLLIPIHWDLWKEYLADPEDVARHAREAKIGAEVRILRLGDTLNYARR